jgi:hypothetical protein
MNEYWILPEHEQPDCEKQTHLKYWKVRGYFSFVPCIYMQSFREELSLIFRVNWSFEDWKQSQANIQWEKNAFHHLKYWKLRGCPFRWFAFSMQSYRNGVIKLNRLNAVDKPRLKRYAEVFFPFVCFCVRSYRNGLSKCNFGDWKQFIQGKYPVPSGNFETLESMRMLFSSSLSGLSTVENNSTFEIIKVCGCFSFRCIIVHAVFQKRRYIKSTRKSNFEDLKQS